MLNHYNHFWLFVTPWTVTCQASLSMGFSWKEYCSGLPVPPLGILLRWDGKSGMYLESSVWEYLVQFSSVQFSRSVMSDSLRPHEPQYARPPCPSPTSRVHPNPCPSSQWYHPAISSSPYQPSPPALNLSQHHGLFKWVSSSHQVAKVLEFQLQHQSFQWTPRTDLL